MKLIVELKNNATEYEINNIKNRFSVLYESKYAKALILDVSDPGLLVNVPGIKSIDSARRGEYYSEGQYFATTMIVPPIVKKTILKSSSLVGWGVKVAVLDSGVPQGINPYASKDFTGTGQPDRLGHSTKVTRILLHYAPRVQLIVGKIGNNGPDESFMIPALEWAVDMGAKIINISGGFGFSKCKGDCIIARIINAIVNQTSCAVICAAGNYGPNNNTIACPACAENAVTVGALDQYGNLARYSSRGKDGQKKPNILAPGSVYFDEEYEDGTSFAAPLISGVLATSVQITGSVQKSIKCLYETANFESLGLPYHQQGAGLIDLEKFIGVIRNEENNSTSERQE